MKKFAFVDSHNVTFSGSFFYGIYNNANFLTDDNNVVTILSKGYQLRQALKEVNPGDKVIMEGMWLTSTKDIPLLVTKSGPNVTIKNNEFTINRLTGLTAAYVIENLSQYPTLLATEAHTLGLKWNNQDPDISKLYLAAVSGTEHFYDQFSFWPLVCALKKLELKKITLEPVLKMAKIKNNTGVRLCQDMTNNWERACYLWSQFTQSKTNLKTTLRTFPKEVIQLFIKK